MVALVIPLQAKQVPSFRTFDSQRAARKGRVDGRLLDVAVSLQLCRQAARTGRVDVRLLDVLVTLRPQLCRQAAREGRVDVRLLDVAVRPQLCG